jgi:hypothetical protein
MIPKKIKQKIDVWNLKLVGDKVNITEFSLRHLHIPFEINFTPITKTEKKLETNKNNPIAILFILGPYYIILFYF